MVVVDGLFAFSDGGISPFVFIFLHSMSVITFVGSAKLNTRLLVWLLLMAGNIFN